MTKLELFVAIVCISMIGGILFITASARSAYVDHVLEECKPAVDFTNCLKEKTHYER